MQYSVKLLENGRTHVQITNGNEKWHVKVAILAACESNEDLNVDFWK